MKETLDSLGRIKLQGVLLLLLIFIVGGVAGAMVSRAKFMRERKPPVDFADGRPDRPDRLDQPLGIPMFFRELDLARDQRQQIRAIIESHRPQIDSLMSATMPRIRDLRDSTEAEIMSILTPEQREKYDRLRPNRRLEGEPFRRPFREGPRRGPR